MVVFQDSYNSMLMNPVCVSPFQKSSSYFTDDCILFQLPCKTKSKSIISSILLWETIFRSEEVQVEPIKIIQLITSGLELPSADDI